MLALFFLFFLETVSASPFRVLVFPHTGTYPSPQGREAVISKVKIASDEVCNQYAAQLNSNHEWQKSGNLLESKKIFSLSFAALRKKLNKFNHPSVAFYFECTKPFTVYRDTSQTAYSYEGNFVTIVGQNNVIQIVNLIDSESYLQGVVPAEVGNSWPVEALKAQAVAARTFAWWTVVNDSGTNYDLDDTIQYQAYLGTSNHTAATDGAVSDTAHQIIKYKGKVIKAYFSADSGGMTESAKNVFGQDLPYCIGKEERYDLSKTKTEWEMTMSLVDIGIALSKNIKLIEVEPNDINASGRADFVTITIDDDQKIKISAPLFRRALKLRSTLFQLKTDELNGQKIVQISGKGYGHGVGMAQMGAKEYALQLGWTFDQIIKFYYTDITLESVTNDYLE